VFLCDSKYGFCFQESNFKRFVEVGRGEARISAFHECKLMYLPVVLLKSGPHAGHIAVIAEIIDHNRVSGLIAGILI
jgi:large subunit ribosomal protein L14e